jgi:hypothetical protein
LVSRVIFVIILSGKSLQGIPQGNSHEIRRRHFQIWKTGDGIDQSAKPENSTSFYIASFA